MDGEMGVDGGYLGLSTQPGMELKGCLTHGDLSGLITCYDMLGKKEEEAGNEEENAEGEGSLDTTCMQPKTSPSGKKTKHKKAPLASSQLPVTMLHHPGCQLFEDWRNLKTDLSFPNALLMPLRRYR